jgi:hypothetical protein
VDYNLSFLFILLYLIVWHLFYHYIYSILLTTKENGLTSLRWWWWETKKETERVAKQWQREPLRSGVSERAKHISHAVDSVAKQWQHEPLRSGVSERAKHISHAQFGSFGNSRPQRLTLPLFGNTFGFLLCLPPPPPQTRKSVLLCS